MSTWHRVPLTALASYVNGYPFKPEDHGQDGWPIVRIEQLKDPDTRYDYFDGKVPKENYIADGDLLFSWSASLFLRIWDRGPAILNQHLFKVIPNPDIDRLFLKYCIQHNLPELTKASHGSTMQHITRRELERFHVELPSSKTEQTAIADILATVDRAIEQTEALIAKQRRIKAGLLHDLLTRGIDEHGRLRDPSTHRFKPSPVGLVPEEWEVKSIDEIAAFVGSGITPTGGSQVYGHEGILFIRSQNVYDDGLILDDVAYIDASINERMHRSQVLGNDVLLNITGASIGRCCFVPASFPAANVNQHVCIIRQHDASADDAIFLSTFIASPSGQRQIKMLNAGGNREGLNYQQVRNIIVPYPGANERAHFAGLVKMIGGAIQRGMDAHGKLLRLKTGLMQDLLSGRVSVAELAESARMC